MLRTDTKTKRQNAFRPVGLPLPATMLCCGGKKVTIIMIEMIMTIKMIMRIIIIMTIIMIVTIMMIKIILMT